MEQSKENEKFIYFANQNDTMEKSNKNAQDTFKYFWRELYWEYRRIIPALNMSMVKFPFVQEFEEVGPIVEHMWVNDIYFDGNVIKGTLINNPYELTNVQNGDLVVRNIDEISDWLITTSDKTYGGFTIHAMRAEMSDEERKAHDEAWGLNFGNFNEILVVNEQIEKPENLIEHPMSINMKDKFINFLKENPDEIPLFDQDGVTLLHKEAIAGNKTLIEILLKHGADKTTLSKSNKTAYNYAKQMKWSHIEELLK